MILETLVVSMLWNLLVGKRVMRAGRECNNIDNMDKSILFSSII